MYYITSCSIDDVYLYYFKLEQRSGKVASDMSDHGGGWSITNGVLARMIWGSRAVMLSSIGMMAKCFMAAGLGRCLGVDSIENQNIFHD